MVLSSLMAPTTLSFQISPKHERHYYFPFQMATNDDDDVNVDSTNDSHMQDFAWRAEKIRLEEANTKSFLKRKPRKLPYLDARRWVQTNLGASTKEEFYDLVANGNVRSPYLSKRPDEYYTQTGDWKGWDHFLTGFFEEAATGLSPLTGSFD